ncbi:MAG: hypothetical protein FJY65_01130 [Calditrichaeota bacterium]|nr:hypothetical protein [Calditrichota bacterium]
MTTLGAAALVALMFAAPLQPPAAKPLQTARIWLFLDEESLPPSELNRRLNETAARLTPRSLQRRARNIPLTPPVRRCDLPPSDERLKAVEATGCRIMVVARYINALSITGPPQALTSAAQLPFVTDSRPALTYIIDDDDYGCNYSTMGKDSNTYYRHHHHHYRDDPADYGRTWLQCAMLNVPAAHSDGLRGQGILIGVQDTGFDNLNHYCFSSLEIAAAWDFLNNDPNVGDQGDLGSGRHGTRTLSVLAGYDPGRFIGIAPQAQYVLTKTENSAGETRIEEDYWVAGLWFHDSLGVDVLSSSVSYREWYGYADMDGRTAVTTRAADSAAAAGMVVVNSMGNTGGAGYPYTKMGAPADGRFVIGVGGVNRDSTYWAASSQGPTYDGRIKPDLAALSETVSVASSFDDTSYFYSNGTSFACPLVAGAAALVLQANPELTSRQTLDILRRTAHSARQPDTLIGWGVPDVLAAIRMARRSVTRTTLLPVEAHFTLYPNPFNGVLTITSNAPIGAGQIVVRDLLGRCVKPEIKAISPNIYQFDFAGLPAGRYWFRYNQHFVRQAVLMK